LKTELNYTDLDLGGRQQSHSFLEESHAQTKQSEQQHLYDQETNLQYASLMNIFTINVGDAAEHLCRNGCSHFVRLRGAIPHFHQSEEYSSSSAEDFKNQSYI
jgi:hypothetical protein